MALSAEHKRNLAQGKKEANAVKAYLEAVGTSKPRGASSSEGLKARLSRTEAALAQESNLLKRLDLTQKKFNLMDRLEAADDMDMDALEKAFVGVAASYSNRKGIGYSAWRALGVPPNVLQSAGIARTRRG